MPHTPPTGGRDAQNRQEFATAGPALMMQTLAFDMEASKTAGELTMTCDLASI